MALNSSRSEAALIAGGPSGLLPMRVFRRALGAPPLLVGDAVRVKSLSEIRATLDSSGCLEGLPFMAEMERFCDKRARIFRLVDKVYDYGGKKDFRRLRNVALLNGLRCDGAAHGGCQAACYLLWKTAWLEAVDDSDDTGSAASAVAHTEGPHAKKVDTQAAVYTCQYTQIVASSQPMASWDIRQYLRPLLAGNVTTLAFVTTVATLTFNAIQRLRGGIGFPWAKTGTKNDSVNVELNLKVGESVRVRSADEIALTLNKRNRNKGLWFDRDMLKHVEQRYTVRTRVESIIDDVTGKMLRMQTPCILLEGVFGSGEFTRLSAQNDYIFWREAWLKRVGCSPEADDRGPGRDTNRPSRA